MPLILGTNSIKDTGYDVDNSLRFNRPSNDSLTKTFSAGNRKTWSFSTWLKRTNLINANMNILGTDYAGNGEAYLLFRSGEQLHYGQYESGGAANNYSFQTNQAFRDTSAWYNILFVWDTTQSTSSDRMKLYVNGTQVTSFSSSTYPSLNLDGVWNSGRLHYIGDATYGTNLDGYLCESVFVDGTALSPTDVGEFDSDSPNIWKPIDVSGLTFGTNGFYQEYKQSGTSANSSGLGADTSGNDHHFTVNNLTAVDQSLDTCTNNFATWNVLSAYNSTTVGTLSEGNLKVSGSASDGGIPSTIGFSQGKWYWEIKYTDEAGGDPVLGIINSAGQSKMQNANSGSVTSGSGVWCIFNLTSGNPGIQENGAYASSNISGAFSDGDIGMFAVDPDAQKIWYGKNGTWYNSGNPATGANATSTNLTANETWFAYVEKRNSSSISEANFGSPSFSISSGNSDANGYGNFEYSVPSGYYALNSKNLAEYG
jgi:hypothetical protein